MQAQYKTVKIRKENRIIQKSGHESNEIRDRLKNSKLKKSTFWNRAISYFHFDVLAASFNPKMRNVKFQESK